MLGSALFILSETITKRYFKVKDTNTWLVLRILLSPQDFCGTIELLWPMKCTRPSLAQVLILKAIRPCTEERCGHTRLKLCYNRHRNNSITKTPQYLILIDTRHHCATVIGPRMSQCYEPNQTILHGCLSSLIDNALCEKGSGPCKTNPAIHISIHDVTA